MKETTYDEWTDIEKMRYVYDLLYRSEYCSQCNNIDIDLSQVADEIAGEQL
jgi:hypothetical protein